MSAVWTWPAYVGVLGGVLLFALLFVPVVAWQVRRYGTLSLPRLLGAAAIAVYVVALVAYTLLPLPSGDLAAWCAAHGFDGLNLDPGLLVSDIRAVLAERGAAGTLRSATFLQGAFNVMLFVPWGVITRRYLGWGFWAATASAVAASLLIETTQYTGVFGMIGCSYRYADVDDLITNVAGAAIGALIAPVVLRWMPQSRVLLAARGTPRPVTAWRRWLGMVIDAFCFLAVGVTLELAWLLGHLVATGRSHDAPVAGSVLTSAVVPFLLVFVLPHLTPSGASWGQRIMWLVPVHDGAPPAAGRRMLRFLGGGGLWGALAVADAVVAPRESGLAGTLGNVLAVVCVIAVLLTRDRRGLSGAVSGTPLADVRGQLTAAPRG